MGLLRLFLALAVLVNHAEYSVGIFQLPPNTKLLVSGVSGNNAVMLFFIVSGFLMSFVIETKYAKLGHSGIRAFYKRRFLRIYPLWWALLLLVAFYFETTWRTYAPADIVSSILLVGAAFRTAFAEYPANHAVFPALLGPGWSLAPEILFYLMAPFALRSARLSILLFAAAAATRAIIVYLAPIQGYVSWCYLFFPSLLVFFLMGHLARIVLRCVPMDRRWSWVLLGISGICMFHGGNGGYMENPMFYCGAVSFALALPGLFEMTKDNKWLNFAGDLTYPLYLSHQTLLSYLLPIGLASQLRAIQTAPFLSLEFWTVMTGMISVALACAYLVHVAIEKPAIWLCRTTIEELPIARIMASFQSKRSPTVPPTR